MKSMKRFCLGLALGAMLTPRLTAQAPAPAPPPPPGALLAPAAPPGAPGAAPPPAAAPAGNLWSFFCMSPEQKAACKQAFCNSIFGKMFTGMMQPVSVFSGGLMGNCCPAAQIAADMAKPADSPEGAAARIKADEAAAKARRADVRYLGTVDCRRWPEAEEALINALRGDRNECVRLEAAWALNRGCCCTRKTIEALALTVSGSTRDGFPRECSDRVRAAAENALNNCLAGLAQPLDVGPAEAPLDRKDIRPGEAGKMPEKLPTLPTAYYKSLEKQPAKTVVEDARRALAQSHPTAPTAQPAAPRGSRGGLLDIVAKAYQAGSPAPRMIEAPEATPLPMPQPAIVSTPNNDLQRAGHIQPVPVSQPRPATLAPPVSQSPYGSTAPTSKVQPASVVQTLPAPQVTTVAAWRPAPTTPPSPPQTQARLPVESQQLLTTLQYSLSEDQRQKAAESLASSTWCMHPDVTAALTTAGRQDSSAAVRATCLRCLSRINFNRLPQ